MSTLEERFWIKVHKTEGCWIWQGANDGRYGQFWANGKIIKAHRMAWQLIYGPIPPGMYVLHHCDNCSCVRPDHLFLGTQSDNLIDATLKGRNGVHMHPERLARGARNGVYTHPETVRRGEAVNSAKLTTDDVHRIRELRGVVKQRDLARMFGVCRTTIQLIQYGQTWRHLLINGGVPNGMSELCSNEGGIN